MFKDNHGSGLNGSDYNVCANLGIKPPDERFLENRRSIFRKGAEFASFRLYT